MAVDSGRQSDGCSSALAHGADWFGDARYEHYRLLSWPIRTLLRPDVCIPHFAATDHFFWHHDSAYWGVIHYVDSSGNTTRADCNHAAHSAVLFGEGRDYIDCSLG
ncbi:hypothetical protein D3C85_1212620 [compost metagenome]